MSRDGIGLTAVVDWMKLYELFAIDGGYRIAVVLFDGKPLVFLCPRVQSVSEADIYMQRHAREAAEKEHQKVVYEQKSDGKWYAFAFFHYFVKHDAAAALFGTAEEVREYAIGLRDLYATRIYNKYLEANGRL